jgi:hypothetical protein
MLSNRTNILLNLHSTSHPEVEMEEPRCIVLVRRGHPQGETKELLRLWRPSVLPSVIEPIRRRNYVKTGYFSLGRSGDARC